MKSRSLHQLPIVFSGPSIQREEARKILEADYRAPIRRGDLSGIAAGSVVAIIDGVFDQELAVSTTEIREALARGVRLFGASSMGALRAVEVPGMVGIGRVFAMYRSGKIDSDDEVAIIFDPETLQALCEPLVNVRHSVDRLASPGTISRDVAAAILNAARKLPYFERTYPRILEAAGLGTRADAAQLAKMLASHDLKREDAITLLEHVRRLRPDRTSMAAASASDPIEEPAEISANGEHASGNPPVHLWEYGPPISFRKVVDFMAFTGVLSGYATKAYTRIALHGTSPPVQPTEEDSTNLVGLGERLLAQTARAWQWATEEEVETSLTDLGIDTGALQSGLTGQVKTEHLAMALIRGGSEPMLRALRVELFLDDLALKRETARALSLSWLAAVGKRGGPVSSTERTAVLDHLRQTLDVRDVPSAFEQLNYCGVSTEAAEALIAQLAYARRLIRKNKSAPPGQRPLQHRWLGKSPKARGSRRFCSSLSQAYSAAMRLRSIVGITRVAMITGLGTVGIPNAQAFRPDGEWSSTVGSGKSESSLGAKVGAIMEEVEKWAQERFSGDHDKHVVALASFRTLKRRRGQAIDPATLDLPYDTCYQPHLKIEWYECEDLATGTTVLVPAAALTHKRLANDIYYSRRGARKTVTTNGLAAGITMAEAITHALCEFVERHARTINSILEENPGRLSFKPKPFVDLDTVPRSTRQLFGKITRAGYRLVVRNITSEIRVPTFAATILIPEGSINRGLFGDDWQRASGWAAHPDPETAIKMAVLEASQTIMSHVAGAREDLTLQARSLGRHERTEARRKAAFAVEMDADVAPQPFPASAGLVSSDATKDVRWIVDRLREAGCPHILIADYSREKIAPVRVVRAIVPGLETINAFYTGPRARMALVRDLLPAQT
jgi:ribosomal protein S12 methylthiotransferase accessory factor